MGEGRVSGGEKPLFPSASGYGPAGWVCSDGAWVQGVLAVSAASGGLEVDADSKGLQ